MNKAPLPGMEHFRGRRSPKSPSTIAGTVLFGVALLASSPWPSLVSAEARFETVQLSAETLPRFSTLEVTFQLDGITASNLQWPFDPEPPPGIEPGIGITVDAVFTDPAGANFRQPAFLYQEFEDEIKRNREWFYPTGRFWWKVRFTPHLAGIWKGRLSALEASGEIESPEFTFEVQESERPGFIRVSPNDKRYFEYDDGTYFPALGYNLNYRRVDWVNPELSNRGNFETLGRNGIQLIRTFLTDWGIFGLTGSPWRHHSPGDPFVFESPSSDGDISLGLLGNVNRCALFGWAPDVAQIPVRQRADYRIQVRYRLESMSGPENPELPFGLVVKRGGWLGGPDGPLCYQPGSGEILTPYASVPSTEWQVLEGFFTTGTEDFLGNLYLALENVRQTAAARDQARVYIDEVKVEELLDDGKTGPNVVYRPDMDQHYYFNQRNSYAFDKLLGLAAEYGVFLKVAVLEKDDKSATRIDFEGRLMLDNQPCPEGAPPNCQGLPRWFYGNYREVTKVRWLQQAWWRYLQARWGFSAQIHSWELMNEGDPRNQGHFALADEFAKFMHCRVFGVEPGPGSGQKCQLDHPNDHLVTTSFWHNHPLGTFWTNPDYPNLDYVDIHRYFQEGDASPLLLTEGQGEILDRLPSDFYDTASFTETLSRQIGAQAAFGAGKPIMRGETGFLFKAADRFAQNDSEGLWLHNLIWGGINPGGMIESYWASPPTHNHIVAETIPSRHDHRGRFLNYFRFIKDLPLSNGYYQDAQASVTSPGLRAWGQKDLTNQRFHLWLQNQNHTWKNVADGVPIPAISAGVSVSGFEPERGFLVEWWDTDPDSNADPILSRQVLTSDAGGSIRLLVEALVADVAVRAEPRSTFYFPHFGDGSGLSTIFVLNNPGPATARGSLDLFDSQGNPQDLPFSGDVGTVNRIPFDLPPYSTRIFRTTGASATVSTGYARVDSDQSSTTGVEIFAYASGAEASVLPTLPGKAFGFFAERSGSLDTGVAIARTRSAGVTASLFGSDGELLASAEIPFPPGSLQAARFLGEIFPGLPEGFQGSLRLDSEGDFTAVGLRFGEGVLSTIPVLDLAATPAGIQLFPHFGDGGGLSMLLGLSNYSELPAKGNLEFRGRDGALQPVLLAEGLTSLWASDLTGNGTQTTRTLGVSNPLRTGFLVLRREGPALGGFAVFRYSSGQEAGVLPVVPGQRFALFVEKANQLDTGIAVSRTTLEPVTMSLYDLAGNLLEPSKALPFAPNEFQQARFLSEFFTLEPGFRGMLILGSTAEFGVMGLRFGGAALSTIPAVPLE